MNHVIYLKLGQKQLLLIVEKIHKMTTIFTQNDDFFQTLTILSEKSSFAQLVTTIIFFAASDESRDLLANSQKLTKM